MCTSKMYALVCKSVNVCKSMQNVCKSMCKCMQKYGGLENVCKSFRNLATANDSPNAFAKAIKSDGLDACLLSCLLKICDCKRPDGNILDHTSNMIKWLAYILFQ